jgi:hypothetical protein
MAVGSHREPTPLPDKETFELSFVLAASEKELFHAEFARRRDNPWLLGVWLVGVLSLSAVVWSLFLLLSGGDALEHFGAAFTLPLVAVALGIVFCAVATRLLRRLRAERLLNTADATVQTFVEGLSLRVGGVKRLVSWTEFSELLTTPHGIYLALRDRTVLMVPVRVFEDEDDRYVFAAIIAKYAGI